MSSSETGGSLGDAEAATIIAAEDLLSKDNIPDENQQTDCFSCGEKLTGLFCSQCGQKNDDYRRSIWSLFSETFASIFSLENRIWRTWLMLMVRPGHVSREFCDGKRIKWTSPVRIYLAMSIILFGYISLTETRIFSVRTDIVAKADFIGAPETLDDAAVRLKPQFGFFKRQAELDKLNAGTDFERVSRLITGIPRQKFDFETGLTALEKMPTDDILKSSRSWPNTFNQDAIQFDLDAQREVALETYTEKVRQVVNTYNGLLMLTQSHETIATRIVEAEARGAPIDIVNEIKLAATKDLKNLTREALKVLDMNLSELGLSRSDIHKLPITETANYTLGIGNASIYGMTLSLQDLQKLSVDVLKNPALLNDGISKYLPRIMFLMMPFAAFIGLVFIRGKKTALLYDHLVHAAYIHAATFAFLLVLIVLSQWTPLRGQAQIFLIGMLVYLPLSAKNMFKRSWFKTFFASYNIAFFYGMTMVFIVAALTVNSMMNVVALP